MPNFQIRAYTVHITNLTKQEISEEDRISHQGLTVQVSIALQLHQGERKKSAVYLFFLDLFFVTFFVSSE
jgi:hypothetical protein